MRNRRIVAVLALGLAAPLVSGCQSSASTDPVSTITKGSDRLRTFTWSDDVLCELSKAARPVSGVLRGQRGANEPVWLEGPGAQHLSVVWPAGFTIAFSPIVELRDEKGNLVARDGAVITLAQTNLDEAAGLFDDPYVAHGLPVGTGCYPFVKG